MTNTTKGGFKNGIKIEKTFYEKLNVVTVKAIDANKLGFIRVQVDKAIFDNHETEIEELVRRTLKDLIDQTKEGFNEEPDTCKSHGSGK